MATPDLDEIVCPLGGIQRVRNISNIAMTKPCQQPFAHYLIGQLVKCKEYANCKYYFEYQRYHDKKDKLL